MQNGYQEFLTKLLVTSLEAKNIEDNISKYKSLTPILSLVFRCEFYIRAIKSGKYDLVLLSKDREQYISSLHNTIELLTPIMYSKLEKLSDDEKSDMIANAKESLSKELADSSRDKLSLHKQELVEYNEFILNTVFPPNLAMNI